jgi:hypothetical protein
MNNLIGQRFERLVAIDEFIEWGKRLGDHLNE